MCVRCDLRSGLNSFNVAIGGSKEIESRKESGGGGKEGERRKVSLCFPTCFSRSDLRRAPGCQALEQCVLFATRRAVEPKLRPN